VKVTSARFDIEALRAFAVTIVVLFHAGLLSIPGGFIGVDVFFVISGYLIIGALYREYITEGRIMILDFWGRRARRLLPASSIVLLTSIVLAYFVSGASTLRDIQYDIVAAATYLANFRFAATGSDYWAPEYISPALHFWSLSVEEQFYIVVPIAVLLAHMILWKVPVRFMRHGFITLVWMTLLASFAYAIHLVSENPIAGYYQTLGRAWEFAAGGLVAVSAIKLPAKTINRHRMIFAGWIGLGLSAIFINDSLSYPGVSTVIPVGLTAFLLWLGTGSRSIAAVELADSKTHKLRVVIAEIGTHSYSIYLWHWPVLWFIAAIWGGENKNPNALNTYLAALGILITLILSYLTKRFVEDPIRFRRDLIASSIASLQAGFKWSFVAVSIVGMTSLLPAAAFAPAPGTAASPTITDEVVAKDSAQAWFENLITEYAPAVTTNNSLLTATPSLDALLTDLPSSRDDGCHAETLQKEPTARCSYGNEGSDTVVYLFGDSHAQHYFDGLAIAAEERGIELRVRTRSGCPVANVTVWDSDLDAPYAQCDKFRRLVIAEIQTEKPALVILSSLTRTTLADRQTGEKTILKSKAQQMWVNGYTKTINTIAKNDIPVVVLRDTPQWGFEISDCLAAYPADDCRITRGVGMASPIMDIDIANAIPNAIGLDPLSLACGEKNCYALRSNIITMRDSSHFTATYSKALAPFWSAFLKNVLPKWEDLQSRK
jgi:peptidoglycan/LPS O-acetylase OafA/YrhL